MKIKGVPSQEGTPFFCHRLKRTASNEEALPGNMPGQSRARYLRAASGTQNRFPVSNRPAKLDGLMKPPGKAGRFDETTRRLAGGFCFMPRGARFVVPGWCAGGQNKTPPSGRRAGKLHIIRPASRSTSRACRMRRTAGSSAWRRWRRASCRTGRRCRATASRRTGRRQR